MSFKGTKLYSILFLKCPRCHEGNFLKANPYKINKFNKVKKNCPCCNLKYSIEPSFYYGSMYVSYGVGIAVAVAIYVLIQIFNLEFSLFSTFISIIIGLVVTMPYIGAVSKSIWANIFFNYDTDIAFKVKKKKQNDSRIKG